MNIASWNLNFTIALKLNMLTAIKHYPIPHLFIVDFNKANRIGLITR